MLDVRCLKPAFVQGFGAAFDTGLVLSEVLFGKRAISLQPDDPFMRLSITAGLRFVKP